MKMIGDMQRQYINTINIFSSEGVTMEIGRESKGPSIVGLGQRSQWWCLQLQIQSALSGSHIVVRGWEIIVTSASVSKRPLKSNSCPFPHYTNLAYGL